MVTRGQFLERPALVPVKDVVMEGLWHRGERRPPLLIIPPAPEEGGSMDHVVATEAAWAAATRGFPTLRFNFRGTGGSARVALELAGRHPALCGVCLVSPVEVGPANLAGIHLPLRVILGEND